jgi:hypothetical protein
LTRSPRLASPRVHLCKRYLENYEKLNHEMIQLHIHFRKRPHRAIDDDDDDFKAMVSSLPSDATTNEYDAYINAPRIQEKIPLLDIWRNYKAATFPHMGFMVRDVLHVPATGAGVERQFSRSGKVETKLRARIDPDTTSKIMMYMDMLKRQKRPLSTNKMEAGVGEYEINSNEEEPPSKWRNDWFKSRKSL